MKALTFLLGLGFLAFISSAPTERPSDDYTTAKKYLLKYGYLAKENQDNPEAFTKALLMLQYEGDIPQTGKVDKATLELMEMPRCDFGNPNLADYRIAGQWRKKSLTYRVRDTTTDMTQQQQMTEIRRAFRVWSDNSDLSFKEVSRGGDIVIRFAKGYHGDGDPFDGPGGTLAHAYFPFAGGDCHLDDDERFTFNSSRGINLFQVVAHELGHSLGLDHSRDRNSLMAAFYRGYIRNFKLPQDDINGIQRLYGPNSNTNNPNGNPTPRPPSFPRTTRPFNFPFPFPTRRPSGGDDQPFCQNSRLDAIFSLSNGATYGFQGDSYVRFTDTGVQDGYPRKIAANWRGLPDNIDAALDVQNSGRQEIWFFKGSRIYYFNSNGAQIRSPQEISQAIPGLPNDIDTAFTWSGNGKIYFMKGSQYYRLRQTLDRLDSGYPKNINVWTQNSDGQIKNALRGGIDTALNYKNGKTYFFKGQNYYRLTDRPLVFDSNYPRPNSYWWFGCST